MSEENTPIVEDAKTEAPMEPEIKAPSDEPKSKDTVAYESYERAMKSVGKKSEQIKAMEAELADFRKTKEEEAQSALEEKGKYAEALEVYKQQLADKELKIAEFAKVENGKAKRKAVQEVLKERELELAGEKAWNLLGMENLSVEDGIIDPLLVKNLIDKAQEEVGFAFISTKSQGKVNPAAHSTEKAPLTDQEKLDAVIKSLV